MKILKLILPFLFPLSLFANHENDLQLWSKYKLEKRLSKKENLFFFYGNRIRENISITSKHLYDFSYQRSFKKFNIKIGYRNSHNYSKTNQSSTSERLYFDSTIRRKLNKFNFSNRIRYQTQKEMGEVEKTLRFKFSVSHSKFKKIQPEISYELFKDLSHKSQDKYRLTTSLNFDLKKRFEYEIYYRLQSAFNNLDNSFLYIVGSSISYRIK